MACIPGWVAGSLSTDGIRPWTTDVDAGDELKAGGVTAILEG
jgi:hypothetical protein